MIVLDRYSQTIYQPTVSPSEQTALRRVTLHLWEYIPSSSIRKYMHAKINNVNSLFFYSEAKINFWSKSEMDDGSNVYNYSSWSSAELKYLSENIKGQNWWKDSLWFHTKGSNIKPSFRLKQSMMHHQKYPNLIPKLDAGQLLMAKHDIYKKFNNKNTKESKHTD